MQVDLEMLQFEQPTSEVAAALEAGIQAHERISKKYTREANTFQVSFKIRLVASGGLRWIFDVSPFLEGTIVTASVIKGLDWSALSAAADRQHVRELLDHTAGMLTGELQSAAGEPMTSAPKVKDKKAGQVAQILCALDYAEKCSARRDALAEEIAIWRAQRVAERGAFGLTAWVTAEVAARMAAKRLRTGTAVLEEIGDELTLMQDRIIHRTRTADLSEWTVRPLDASVRAALAQGTDSSSLAKPSLAKAAFQAVRGRSAWLVLTHPQWKLEVPVDASAADRVTDLVARVNAMSSTSSSSGFEAIAATPVSASPAATVADQLRDLAGLHRDGVLSDDEFAAAKAKLLR